MSLSFLLLPESLRVSGGKEREKTGVANPINLSSVFLSLTTLHFPYLDQVPSYKGLEQGSAHPQCLERVQGHLVGTGLFLFGRAEIELPRPGFELTTLNSVTFRPIFSPFKFNLAN